MTLPVSPNSISLSQVAVELGRSATATTSLGESAVRTLAGVPSGSISLSNLFGKSNYIQRAYMMGGIPSDGTAPRNEIDGLDFVTETAINPATTLGSNRNGAFGMNSLMRGYSVAGVIGTSSSATLTNEIDGIQFDNESFINPSATLPTLRSSGAGVNSAQRGYAMGGIAGTTFSSEIDGMIFSSETSINPSATLINNIHSGAPVSSATRGYSMGGLVPSGYSGAKVVEICGIQFDSETAVDPAAALSLNRAYAAGFNSSTAGYAAGGNSSAGAIVTEIDGILFSNEAAINPGAALTTQTQYASGTNSNTNGYVVSGDVQNAVRTGAIQRFVFSSESTVTISATLPTPRTVSVGVQSYGNNP